MVPSLTRKSVSAVGAALLTAVLSMAMFSPAFADFQRSRELAHNCAKFNLQNHAERKVSIDIENEIVFVNSSTEGFDEPHGVMLPLKKTKNASEYTDCSPSAEKLLTEVQTVYSDYIKESCADFTAVIDGTKALPEKNGVRADIKGAHDFVKRFCQ